MMPALAAGNLLERKRRGLVCGINIRGKKTRMEYVFSRAVDDFLIELSGEARP